MPVQIPQLPRNSVQAPESVGRVEVKPLDVARPMEIQTTAIEHLGKVGLEYYMREKKNAADNASLSAGYDYHNFLQENLEGPNGAKHQKGDPTPVYAKYDEDAKQKYNDILSQYQDKSPETLAAVKAKLTDIHMKFQDRRTSAFGAQNADYTKGLTHDSVELTKNDMMDSSAHLDVTDPHTLIPLQKNVDEIANLRLKEGIKIGTVKPVYDPKGEIDPATGQVKILSYSKDPSVNLQIAKDTSDGLTKTIENLIASGDVDGAKFVTEKFSSYLDIVNKTKVEEKTKKAFKEQEGLRQFARVQSMQPDKAIEQLKKIQDPDVQDKAMATYDTFQRRIENEKIRFQKDNYERISKIITERQKTAQPFLTVEQMESDPSIKRMIDKVDPKQYKTLSELVEKPKTSNESVKTNAYSTMFNGGLQNMSPEEFNQLVTGLNDEDRKVLQSKWILFNTPTDADKARVVRQTGITLEKQLFDLGYIKKNAYGKYSNENQKKLNEAQTQLMTEIETLPATSSIKEQVEYAKKFATNIVKTNKPAQGWFSSLIEKFQGTTNTPPEKSSEPTVPTTQPSKPAPQAPSTIKTDSERDARKEFYRQTNRNPTVDELNKFIKNGNKL